MPLLTAVVLTLNEEAHLPDCLASLAFADAVLVFDSFSSDRTIEIAGAAGARVVQHAFTDYAAQRNAALDAVQSDWVFFVDADERVPAPLAQAVRSAIAQPAVAAWWVPRHNYILGRLTLQAGWFPDYQLRLLRPDCVRYDSSRPVHELALINGASAQLAQPLVHLNYATIQEFVAKQRVYAELAAAGMWRAGKRARAHQPLTMALRQFYWRFVTLAGWRMGVHGVLLALLMAHSEWRSYSSLRRRIALPADTAHSPK